ncbi:universal stress protein [Streptosporangium sp. NPDC023615]|uniref:universal stress protein n=1 Tax=Streptosporangium sp. NPDC023615 TaxID=3154794 RepID=UPI00344176C3
MKIEHVLAGFVPGSGGRDGLALALLLARQAGAGLTVAHVHVPAWTTPGPGKVDAEWRAHVARQAAQTLSAAREQLSGVRDVEIDFLSQGDRGSGRGLAALAGRIGADVVAVGPAPRGARGRIRLGSTADQLLHGSPVPVALAPQGYAVTAPERLVRLAVAYRRGPACAETVHQAATVAAGMGVPLRLITLVTGGGRRSSADREMLLRVRERAAADLEAAALAHGRIDAGTGGTGTEAGMTVEVEVEVLEGGNVETALASSGWHEDALLICASSRTGPLRRVFLGDTSLKIIRASPSPVIMLTRIPRTARDTARNPGKT